MVLMPGMPEFLKGASLNYFDMIVVVWLDSRNRPRPHQRHDAGAAAHDCNGLLIVVVAGFSYAPLGRLIFQSTAHAFNQLWSNVTAYVVIGFAIHLFFLWIKQGLGDKLEGSDYFGRGEYYLGMAAGFLRFASMVVVVIALDYAFAHLQRG